MVWYDMVKGIQTTLYTQYPFLPQKYNLITCLLQLYKITVQRCAVTLSSQLHTHFEHFSLLTLIKYWFQLAAHHWSLHIIYCSLYSFKKHCHTFCITLKNNLETVKLSLLYTHFYSVKEDFVAFSTLLNIFSNR